MVRIPQLDKAGLRKFGITTGILIAVLFGLFIPWLFELDFVRWPWIVGGVLAAWALVAPASLKPVYTGWMRLGLVLNKITMPIILGLLFFVLIAPLAIVMRIFGRKPLTVDWDPSVRTYRVKRDGERTDMDKPY